MKSTKLKLDLDALEIASFATQAAATDAQGTVAAHGTDPVILTITSSSLLTPALTIISNN